MYQRSARIYDALNRRKDYAAAAGTISQILLQTVGPRASVLDVACGTGRHLAHLRTEFCVSGLDQSVEMLQIARERCPGIEFHAGDLRNFTLASRFDAITCLFGSIAYATTVEDLDGAIENMAGHLNARGALVIEPWLEPDRFVPDRLVFDSVDETDLKVARMYVPRLEGRVSVYDIDFLVGTGNEVTHFTEHERLGLFTRDEYVSAFRKAGLHVADKGPDLFGYGLFVGVRTP